MLLILMFTPQFVLQDGDTQDCAASTMKYSRPQIAKFVNSFFNNPKCHEMYKLAIRQSENDFRDFIA